MVGWRRLSLGGLVCSAITLLAGGALELWWLGGSEPAAFERVERDVRARFDEMSASLRATAVRLTERARDDLIRGVTGDRDTVPSLFEIVRTSGGQAAAADLAVTIYGPDAIARAWSGRPSELPRARILGEAALFAAPGPLGLRLVHLEPVIDRSATVTSSGLPRRLGSIAVERVLSPTLGVGDPPVDSFLLPTSIASVFAART